jgi:electron-transferring-flavoprotein dehydrogenase
MAAREREILEVDCLLVGAGPASLAAACRLGQLLQAEARQTGTKRELSIAVLEKGPEVGAHALSGAVVDPKSFQELFPEKFSEIPFESPVTREHVLWLGQDSAFELPWLPPPLQNHGKFVASLGKLVRWLAREAESFGVEIFCEFPGRELLFEGQQVVGVRTGEKGLDRSGKPKRSYDPGVDIRAGIVLLGEGPRGSLAKELEQRLHLTHGRNPQVYALGIKEVWELPDDRVAAGEIWHTMGWPLWPDIFGGGFLYGMQDRLLAIGLVAGLDSEDPLLDPHREFQRFKTHPKIRKILDGGKLAFYGAKAIPEGGYFAMPQLGGDGFCLLGDSAGFLDGQRLKGIHLAMKSGMLAAEAVFATLQAGRPLREAGWEYVQRFEQSWAREELWASRNFHQGFERGGFDGLVNAALASLTGGRGWGVFDRLPAHYGHERMLRLTERADLRPRPEVPPDGKLVVDRLTDVFHSGTGHEEDQPVHLLVADPTICSDRCVREYANPCTRLCPAAVYEMVPEPSTPSGLRLQINASNCVHCKTCDIADPYQIVTWVPPEGGGGPNYGRM